MSALDLAIGTARLTLRAMGQGFGGMMPIQKPKPIEPTPRPGPFDDNYVAPPRTGSVFGHTDKENSWDEWDKENK